MGKYKMGKNADGNPFEEKNFYIHTTSGRIVQLFRDAAGFREVEDGENVNIFHLSNGKSYRSTTESDFQNAITKCNQRKQWLQKGLADICKSPTD